MFCYLAYFTSFNVHLLQTQYTAARLLRYASLRITFLKKAIFIMKPVSHKTINAVFHISHKLHNRLIKISNDILINYYLLSYLLTYTYSMEQSPRKANRFSASQEIPRIVKKFPAFYGTQRFFTAFTRARHLSLSSARSIQSMPPYPTS